MGKKIYTTGGINEMKTKCPHCGYIATRHETLDSERNPKDGDVGFCINCGEVNMFSNRGLVKVNIETLPESTQEYIKKIEHAWLKAKSLANIKENAKK